MKITNHTRTPYGLGGYATIMPNAVTEIPDNIWDMFKNVPVVKGWVENGWISPGGEKPVVEEAPTAMTPEQEMIAEVIRELSADNGNLNSDGKIKMDVLNGSLENNITAAERDRIYDLMEENK